MRQLWRYASRRRVRCSQAAHEIEERLLSWYGQQSLVTYRLALAVVDKGLELGVGEVLNHQVHAELL